MQHVTLPDENAFGSPKCQSGVVVCFLVVSDVMKGRPRLLEGKLVFVFRVGRSMATSLFVCRSNSENLWTPNFVNTKNDPTMLVFCFSFSFSMDEHQVRERICSEDFSLFWILPTRSHSIEKP